MSKKPYLTLDDLMENHRTRLRKDALDNAREVLGRLDNVGNYKGGNPPPGFDRQVENAIMAAMGAGDVKLGRRALAAIAKVMVENLP